MGAVEHRLARHAMKERKPGCGAAITLASLVQIALNGQSAASTGDDAFTTLLADQSSAPHYATVITLLRNEEGLLKLFVSAYRCRRPAPLSHRAGGEGSGRSYSVLLWYNPGGGIVEPTSRKDCQDSVVLADRGRGVVFPCCFPYFPACD